MRSCLFCTETPTNRLPQTGQYSGSPGLGAVPARTGRLEVGGLEFDRFGADVSVDFRVAEGADDRLHGCLPFPSTESRLFQSGEHK